MPKFIHVIDPAINNANSQCFNDLVVTFPDFRFTIEYPGLFPRKDQKLDLEHADGIIILGSSAYVTDNHAWVHTTAAQVDERLRRGIPVLAICFGHQMMAHFYGSTVGFIDEENNLYHGLRTVKFSEHFAAPSEIKIAKFASTHRQEVKTVGKDLRVIASSSVTPVESVRHNHLPHWGVQFHPEASRYFMRDQITVMNDEDIDQAKNDGTILLQNFLTIVAATK